MSGERRFRVCVFASAPPVHLRHLLWRIEADAPEVAVAGVLFEDRPAVPGSLLGATRGFLSRARDPDFSRYGAWRLAERVRGALHAAGARVLDAAHGTPGDANPPPPTLEELAAAASRDGVAFEITDDIHSAASHEFVRRLDADIGVIFGARILRESLFSIPRLGSVNSHQHELPDFRGSGPPGLWELRDGRASVVLTVHRVTADVDAGAILDERSFAIEPLDTFASMELKANVLGVDGLLEVIRGQSRGPIPEKPQTGPATTFKGIPPHRMWAMERAVQRRRDRAVPAPLRPRVGPRALLAYGRACLANRRRIRQGGLPPVVLGRDVVSDTPGDGVLSTDALIRHVAFLRRHYRIVALRDAVEAGAHDVPALALTFDARDGGVEDVLGLRAVVEPERIPVTVVRRGEPPPSLAGVRRVAHPEAVWQLELALQARFAEAPEKG